jgi:DNA polymerase-3 subunit chi|tara:strand:+ start:6660 stop:7088 length:429 start_codon:yes stop_codon:yes gene_type:complete
MQVFFHYFEKTSGRDLLVYICRLVEKGYKQGSKPIYIHFDSENEAKEFDSLLWTFRQESFIPHTILGHPEEEKTPVIIGWDTNQIETAEALINVSQGIPRASTSTSKIHEIVGSDENKKNKAREKWKAYKANGSIIKAHKAD